MANEILQFAETDIGTNLLTQSEYNSDAQRLIGNQPGIARSKLVNKVLRQTAFMSSALAEFIANKTGSDVLDDGDRAALVTLMETALQFTPAISTKTSSYTLTSSDDIILANGTLGAFTLTLPASPATGKTYTLKRIDGTLTNVIAISGTGLSGVNLHTDGETWVIAWDGSAYQILDHRTETDWSTPVANTFISSVANPVVKGTIVTDEIMWKRDGGDAIIRMKYKQSAASGSGAQSGTYGYRIELNSTLGLTIDTSVTGTNTSINVQDGNFGGTLLSSVGGSSGGGTLTAAGSTVKVYDTSTVRIIGLFGAAAGIWGTQNPISNTNCQMEAFFRVPILNWKA